MVDLKALVPWRDKSHTPAPREEHRDPFLAFRREIDRMFDDFFHGAGGRALGSPFGPWSGVTPTLDMTETDKELVVTAELPGLDEKDFEVTVSGDVLTLRGEKRSETEDKNRQFSERFYGRFERRIPLGYDVEEDKVSAAFKNGVLTVTLPKTERAQAKAKRIAINGKS